MDSQLSTYVMIKHGYCSSILHPEGQSLRVIQVKRETGYGSIPLGYEVNNKNLKFLCQIICQLLKILFKYCIIQGTEAYPISIYLIWVCRLVAMAGDCKSPSFGIRWCKSNSAHQAQMQSKREAATEWQAYPINKPQCAVS